MNYGKIDGESLAVLSGIMANRSYLYGTKFTVVGDHLPLIPLYKSHSRELPVRVARHRAKLGGIDFQLQYEPGSTNPSDYGLRHLKEDKNKLQHRAGAGSRMKRKRQRLSLTESHMNCQMPCRGCH
jgi:hypothetical protein